VSDQLDALRDVAAAFERSGVEYWLFGGWAVDFHAGAVTREHDDVDVAIWLDDMPRISRLLGVEGWRDLEDPDTDGGIAFGRGEVRLELTYLYKDEDGEIYTPLLDGTRGRWTSDSLGGEVKTLEGVTARVVSLGPLTRMKERGRKDPADAAKDRADFELLNGL
jgi:aminoglycoside-2''-adenylyltransferase